MVILDCQKFRKKIFAISKNNYYYLFLNNYNIKCFKVIPLKVKCHNIKNSYDHMNSQVEQQAVDIDFLQCLFRTTVCL